MAQDDKLLRVLVSYFGFRNGFMSMISTKGGAQWWQACSWMFVDFGVEIDARIADEGQTIEAWTELVPFFGPEE